MEIVIGTIILIAYFIYRLLKVLFVDKNQQKETEITMRFVVTEPEKNSVEYLPYGRARGKPARWYKAGESVVVQGFHIPGGLIYVGETLLDSGGYSNDSCLINPKLKVTAAAPWDGGNEMGYWPNYSLISEKCRGAYLTWLKRGRTEPEVNIGYVFLFFYGLERRLFIDSQNGSVSAGERAEIVQEVIRLLRIYRENRSFRGYASNFLAMEWVLFQSSDKPVPSYLDLNDRYCIGPFQVVLAQYVAAGKPIPAELALQWLNLHPEFGLRTPARRCSKEFRELFFSYYKEQFGEGLLVKPNKTPLRLEYHAASSSLPQGIQFDGPDLPNPFNLKSPLKKLSTLIEKCIIELEPYSRFLGRKDSNPNSLSALALLPNKLINLAPASKKVKSYLADICTNRVKLISVNELYEKCGDKPPLQMGKKESESLAAFVEGLGFGMAPDLRFHNQKLHPDGKVAIFKNGHGVDFRPSREFRTLGTILRLGAMVSQIDEDISLEEEATLQNLIHDNRNLTLIEKDSLMAFLHWCLHTVQGTAGIKQRLAEVSAAEKAAISHILISVAYADGRIHPKEVKQLEKLYVTLGLDKEQVSSDLHSLAAASEPITVGLRDQEIAFAIPKAKESKGFRLNEELIRIREEETRQVRGVLEEIFSDQADEEADIGTAQPVSQPANPLSELDQSHQVFFKRLVKQETWKRKELQLLCKELGLMVDGAMEVVNEWAFNNANASLIDDGEPVFVDVNLAMEIINV